jgi:hypothetical protein
MLFRHLPPDLFRPLANSYRAAYEAVLRRLHAGVFSSDYFEPITRQDLQAEIAEALLAHRSGLDDEARASFRLDEQLAYAELRETGWLVEQRDGWKTLVEMDRMAFRVMHFLCTLETADSNSFTETLVTVINNFDGALNDPDRRATGLMNAARQAREFAAYVRSIVGTLRTIEQRMMEQGSLNGFVNVYFDDFIKQVVARDYRNLTLARNHPNSLRYRVEDIVESLHRDPSVMVRLHDSLIAGEHAADEEEAARLVDDAVRGTLDALEAIEGFRLRIDRSRQEVERRFETAIRYMTAFGRDGGVDYVQALRELGEAFPPGSDGCEPVEIDVALREPLTHFDLARAREAPMPRAPVERTRHVQAEPDPVALAFQRAKDAFGDWLQITPDRFVAYVARQVEEHGPTVEARDIPPTDLQEVVIFSLLRALPLERIALPGGVRLIRREGTVENLFLSCGDFALVREDAIEGTEVAHAV